MTEPGSLTKAEILSQPEAWTAALKILKEGRRSILDLKPADRFDQILFTGCGSTYYLALAAAALTQELWLSPCSSYANGKTLLVAVSRSGETSETLQACRAFLDEKRGELLTVSCYEEMPLARMGRLNLVLPSGQERSVAQTRAFTTLYLATTALAILWGGQNDLFEGLDRLPQAGQRILDRYIPLAKETGRDPSIDRFYWLGSGPRYGLASELSLKMKEMSLSHSEPFHFLEFRHGPKSMVTPSALIVGLLSTSNAGFESAVLDDVKKLGGQIIDMAETDASVCFESGLEEAVRNILYLPFGQMVAFERSLSKKLNPDRPNNLDSVVKLQGGEERN